MNIIEETGRVTQKGQVTIPNKVRARLNIEEGDRLRIILDDNGEAKFEVIKKRKLADSFGVLGKPPIDPELTIDEAIQATREERGSTTVDENGD